MQSDMNTIQWSGVVNLSNGMADKPKVIVTIPIPLPTITEGMNQASDIFIVPAIIVSASSGNVGRAINNGK
jgi:hypothetical protein